MFRICLAFKRRAENIHSAFEGQVDGRIVLSIETGGSWLRTSVALSTGVAGYTGTRTDELS